ncbi:MAG TPA: dihydrolipoamide succinyltransferase, partial [Alphaproteobacteria bacterium]|nr:dihydrolipoamide succinyltransferase [Alphaproteobacteria bacterium]
AAAQLAPSVRKLVAENDLDPSVIPASGKDGRLTKGDVLSQLEKVAREAPSVAAAAPAAKAPVTAPAGQDEREERVRMTRLRKTIAQRLKDAQNTAAMLTTFNE